MNITWFGHSAFMLGKDRHKILIDPFLSGNPYCPPGALEAARSVQTILVTHGHGDHLGDTLDLARASGARVVTIYEIAHYLIGKGLSSKNVIGMNIGGALEMDFGVVHMVQAIHSNSIMDGNHMLYGGYPAGFVVEMGAQRIYHAGDTALFSDMALIQSFYKPSIGLLPIGGHYTMTPDAAAYACNTLLDLDVVIPMHYDTFPVIQTGAQEFAAKVKRGRAQVLAVGQGLELS